MNSNSFADTLKHLMKKRKISGQQLADRLGVSQKTVSRYATGETVPESSVQQKLLDAVAELGGHPEDANAKKTLFVAVPLRRSPGLPVPSDGEILDAERQETEFDKKNACAVFSMLEKSNQKLVLENFEVFADIEGYEIAVVEAFSVISEDRRSFVLNSLETVRMSFSAMKEHQKACHKISNYLEMMKKCKAAKPESAEKFDSIPKDIAPTQYVLEYSEKLEKIGGVNAEILSEYLPEMVSFNEKDWYLLTLFQYLSLNDTGANSTYYGAMVGDRVNFWINFIENGAKGELT